MYFLLELHPIFSFLIISAISVAIAVGGLGLIRKRIPPDRLKENHEVAAIIFNAFGLVYAVLLAFVVFVTWSTYNTADNNTEMEANKLSDLFLDAGAFPDSTRKEIRTAITEYAKSVVENDWVRMGKRERQSPETIQAMRKIWNAYIKIDGQTINNPQMYSESLTQLNAMSEYRRLRWNASRQSVPLAIWVVLITGSIATIFFTFFFGSRHYKTQNIMTSVLFIMNACVLYLIYILDHPFFGYSAISDDPFRSLINWFTRAMGN
jgi:hypothetical protein